MTRLFEKYLDTYEPKRWRELFLSADKNAYQVKYMFREQISITKTKFTDHVSKSPSSGRDMYEKLVDAALTEYGEQGLVPQEELARSNFLENPKELLDVVETSIQKTKVDSKLWRLRQICKAWMEVCVEQDRPAMTPHHTQALIMLIFAKFYECKKKKDTAVIPAKESGGIKFRHIIGQMSTGEGKSIVIAMLAIFLLQEYEGEITRVHILENNNGLLERDYETYEPLFKKFKLKSGKVITSSKGIVKGDDLLINPDVNICYCLKRGNQSYFKDKLLDGKLDLDQTVLIVDEVDDLVINEKPAANYNRADKFESVPIQEAIDKLKGGATVKPPDMPLATWREAKGWVKAAESKEEGVDYELGRGKNGEKELLELVDGKIPKVPKSYGWLTYLNSKELGRSVTKGTPFLNMCTPYMYDQYNCIFGLTGSVGGDSERTYIENTFGAVPYEVPLFLSTCKHTSKAPAQNKGVMVVKKHSDLVNKVVQLAKQYFTSVPVLIISQGKKHGNEMRKLFQALKAELPKERPESWSAEQNLLLFEEKDEAGRSHGAAHWKQTIEDSMRQHGTEASGGIFYPVTITDLWGGRGHDFDCKVEAANDASAGGLLVIATSVPDVREWIQWKGRTARQDRPGQFYVVMSEEDELFQKGEKGLASALEGKNPDEKIAHIHEVHNKDTMRMLNEFKMEQANGAWKNELCQQYYKAHRRDAENADGSPTEWPYPKFVDEDKKLREILRETFDHGAAIKSRVLSDFKIDLKGPPPEWGVDVNTPFGFEKVVKKKKLVVFIIDRTYPAFLPVCLDAVETVIREHIDDEDRIAFFSLGHDEALIPPTPKAGNEDHLIRKVQGAKECDTLDGKRHKGGSQVYSSIIRALDVLLTRPADDGWLILLSDLVDLTFGGNPNNGQYKDGMNFEQAQEKLMDEAKEADVKLRDMKGTNFIAIDASEIAKWEPQHKMWDTWKNNVRMLADTASRESAAIGRYLTAATPAEIAAVFEQVAAAMVDVGGVAD